MTDNELKPCPFCKGKAEIKRGNAYYVPCVYAHCTECGATMPKVPINHLFYTQGKQVRLTEEQATMKAINAWNRRARNEYM
jgi:Lar family restriction alleviation protein